MPISAAGYIATLKNRDARTAATRLFVNGETLKPGNTVDKRQLSALRQLDDGTLGAYLQANHVTKHR